MVYGQYVYTDDAGNDWQVSVPVDFATALSMVAATTQPYLDETIAPRWCNFRAASGQLRQAVIKSAAQFAGIIGTVVTVGGISYTGTSAKGETMGAIQPNLIQPPQALMGPPGPPGPGASVSSQYAGLAADTTLPAGSGPQNLAQLTLTPGTYLLFGRATIEDTSGAANQAYLRLEALFGALDSTFSQCIVEANSQSVLAVNAIVQPSTTVYMTLGANTAGNAKALGEVRANGAVCDLIAVKIA